MPLATIRTDTGTSAAVIENDSAHVLAFDDAGEVIRAIAQGQKLSQLRRIGEVDLATVALAPPVPYPEKIICVGLNFRSHAEEAKLAKPEHPMLFAKYSRSLIGANDDIVIPPESDRCDWEAELAVVIGKPARRVRAADALDVVAGYTLVNDISMRNWQRHTSQFLPGKTFEHSTPVGPWIVSPEDVDHARDMRLRCLVNGDVRQDGSTADMIFSVAEVIEYASTVITLVPGDIIAMGTPSGVGSARTPPLFLREGDVVSTEGVGIGVLTNLCVQEVILGART